MAITYSLKKLIHMELSLYTAWQSSVIMAMRFPVAFGSFYIATISRSLRSMQRRS